MKFRSMLFLFSVMLVFTSFVWAQDPNVVAPDSYKKLFENDRVRVHHVTLKPDGKIPMHSHPDHLGYAMTDCTLTFTGADGKSETASVKQNDVVWFPALSHSGHNTGKNECHVLVVELKEPMAK
ncbi:cupin domain-containing protein [bacterium]|nr:cupin domain-containing protein [bacterium]